MSLKSEHKSSWKAMAKLNEDIIAEILSRLPVKSLIRFKCACKAWFALISDPQFAKFQLKQARAKGSANLHKLLLTTCPLQTLDFEAFSEGDNGYLCLQLGYPVRRVPEYEAEIVGACNGLVCLVFDYDNLVLWNPTTRDSKELPDHDNPSLPRGSIFYGLGYDISIDDYKVLWGVIPAGSNNGSKEAKVQVLTLKTNTWRGIQHPLSGIGIVGLGTLSNNALHWVGTQVSDSGNKDVIISFDLTDERFEEFAPLPDHFGQNVSIINFGTFADCLVIFVNRNKKCFEAWEMEEYGVKKSWTRLFSVSTDRFPAYEYFPTLLIGFTKDGKALLDNDGRKLLLYNTTEETFRNFMVHDEWDRFEAVIYEESLVSPNVEAEASRLNQPENGSAKEEDSGEEVRQIIVLK